MSGPAERGIVVTIDATSNDDTVRRAGAAIRAGGLVAIPTETVYGLGCNALDADAVAAVFAAKGRPASDPLIVHVDGTDMAREVIDGDFSPVAARLAGAFWPGPLTMVLPRDARLPSAVTAGGPTVGVRCPAHPVARAIIAAAAVPVAAPSANRFGHISPTTAGHVVEELGDRVDLIVDAGPTTHGLESTVIGFDGDTVVVLRDGAITREQLASHAEVRSVGDDATSRASAPGHDVRHYSPRTPTIATSVAPPPDAPTGRVVYAGYGDAPADLPEGWTWEGLGRRDDLAGVASRLYAVLRTVDAVGPDLLVIELTGATGLGRAIDDRLTRAAAGVVATTPDELRQRVRERLALPPANR